MLHLRSYIVANLICILRLIESCEVDEALVPHRIATLSRHFCPIHVERKYRSIFYAPLSELEILKRSSRCRRADSRYALNIETVE